MMETAKLSVQGSSPEPYLVTFLKRGEHMLSGYCTCPAGENGQHCKHRINILKGSSKNVVDGETEIPKIMSWLPGTEVEKALLEMSKLEVEAEKINKQLRSAKKMLSRTLHT